MPRRGRVIRRVPPPDVKYGSVKVARLINKVMRWGKKSKAEKIVYGAFDITERRLGRNPLEIFEEALQNTTPLLEVKPRRIGGATYQVPVEVPPERGFSLAIRWLVQAAQVRKGKPMIEKLAVELTEAARREGAAVKKRHDTHRMAEANRAFVHYRW